MEKKEKHDLNELGEQEAFVHLLEHVIDPTNATRHNEQFDLLTNLVKNCKCYLLTLGKDLGALPSMFKDLAAG